MEGGISLNSLNVHSGFEIMQPNYLLPCELYWVGTLSCEHAGVTDTPSAMEMLTRTGPGLGNLYFQESGETAAAGCLITL